MKLNAIKHAKTERLDTSKIYLQHFIFSKKNNPFIRIV